MLNHCVLFLFFRCKLRVVDSFGTDAQFNFNLYKEKLPGGALGVFGRYNLNLRQFQTMFRELHFMYILLTKRQVNMVGYWSRFLCFYGPKRN